MRPATLAEIQQTLTFTYCPHDNPFCGQCPIDTTWFPSAFNANWLPHTLWVSFYDKHMRVHFYLYKEHMFVSEFTPNLDSFMKWVESLLYM